MVPGETNGDPQKAPENILNAQNQQNGHADNALITAMLR